MDKEQVLREILGLARTALALHTSLMPEASDVRTESREQKQEWDDYFLLHHPLWEAVFVLTKAVDQREAALVREVA